tara:strand:- start:242 stop:361 length:120 start_codon:yes stop_codon:yes gene_type:complete
MLLRSTFEQVNRLTFAHDDVGTKLAYVSGDTWKKALEEE